MNLIEKQVSGGCQCGAVRYHSPKMLDNAHLCHCRMCQKAVGNIFAALVAAPDDAVVWTRGTPAVWRSSEHVERGFCANCGTPLFYHDVTNGRTNLTIGSLDNPDDFKPHGHDGIEAQVSWFGDILSIEPGADTDTGVEDWAAAIKATNRQHPDYDTKDWQAAGRE